MDVVAELEARGFIKQSTGLEELRERLASGQVTFYVGFDPTAISMHVGNMLPIMAMAHLQRAGHRVICVIGGGTAMVGDPSGKTEMRSMLTEEQIAKNTANFREQFERFLTLDDENGILVNNSEWLLSLSYIGFLRDIGRHFSVNRMLTAEAYRQRLERGLSFIEFNYQLLQAYDFLELYRRYGCTLQLGGDDQWGNILAGTDLVRRVEGADVDGLTFPLLTTASGAKMGKTARGAVWLDASLMTPFDFYQFWYNVDDRDVGKLLRLYTFLPLERIAELEKLEGADLREAKKVLAFEVTQLVHGEEAARAATSRSNMPEHTIQWSDLEGGIRVYVVLCDAQMTASRGEARRLLKGGAVRAGDTRLTDPESDLLPEHVSEGSIVVRIGKKRALRVNVEGAPA